MGLLLLLLAGCAVTTERGIHTLGTPLAGPCLPPGMPALSTLVIVRVQLLGAPIHGGGTVQAIRRSYMRPENMPEVPQRRQPDYWVYEVEGTVVSVDDGGDADPDRPNWIDPGMLTDRGEVRADRHPTCQWRRMVANPI